MNRLVSYTSSHPRLIHKIPHFIFILLLAIDWSMPVITNFNQSVQFDIIMGIGLLYFIFGLFELIINFNVEDWLLGVNQSQHRHWNGSLIIGLLILIAMILISIF